MPDRITITDELADRLWYAQAEVMHEMTEFVKGPISEGSTRPWNDLRGGRTGDDPGDYWSSCIDLFQAIFEMRWDEDPKPDLDVFLNTPVDHDLAELKLPSGRTVTPLWQLACDGIANAFYELDCPSLPTDD